MNKRLGGFLVAAALAMMTCGQAKAVTIFDASQQFDPNNNPSTLGPWSYGSAPFNALSTGFTLYGVQSTEPLNGGPVNVHNNGGGFTNVPHLTFNPNAVAISSGTVVIDPQELSLHPGQNGQFSILRFTAPTAGNYNFQAIFQGNDVNQGTTDVFVLRNGTTLKASFRFVVLTFDNHSV